MKRTIQGVEYDFSERRIAVEKLRFWPDNPRIYGEIFSLYDNPDSVKLTRPQLQEEIYRALKNSNSTRELRDDIKREGGLIENLIVQKRQGEEELYDVLEGNRRLAACRMIIEHDKGDSLLEDIPCEVVSENMPASVISALLGHFHITGKDPWSPFAKASYLKRRYEILLAENHGKTEVIKIVAKEIGETPREISTQIKNIELMGYAKEENIKKYSYYDVVNRNRNTKSSIKNEDYKKRIVDSIQDWKKPATEFRKAIMDAYKHKKP